MREVGSRGPGGKIGMLGYDDPWGEREYVYTFTDICDRAGCHCEGDQAVCSHWGPLFVSQLYLWYKDDCLTRCECFQENSDILLTTESISDSALSDTWSSVGSVKNHQSDWALYNARKMREVYGYSASANRSENGRDIEESTPSIADMLPNRLNGGKPCLAGQAAGWTFQDFTRGHCCPGYWFNRLTASEAYVNYGLPIGNIVSGIWVVGMCLKTIS